MFIHFLKLLLSKEGRHRVESQASNTRCQNAREKNMAEKLDLRETVGLEELLMSNVIEQEALVNLLVAKGIIKNAENLLVIRDKNLAAKYVENWKVHWEHSEIYQGRK
jgi:ribosomal protein L15